MIPMPEPQKMPVEDVIRHVAALIRKAERQLMAVQDEVRHLDPAADITRTSAMMVEISKILTRRRTLIEVWEFASNAVWRSHIVNNQ